MSRFYKPFLALLPPGASILDAGCGSGRDSFHFLKQGYQVVAMDASRRMVELSTELLGQQVLHLTFQELSFKDRFDGIWAYASMLHVPRSEMDEVMRRLTGALKAGGVLFTSFKLGDEESIRNGRFFNDYDEKTFEALLERHANLELLQLWQTQDVRAYRQGEYWLNALVKKRA